ncbi:hypothetical protein BD769DRAFT_649256 [Suillus cothurnatus]|nr:hypothetical protein BD769DRAFT_649256 [Suillus cothurnatus]
MCMMNVHTASLVWGGLQASGLFFRECASYGRCECMSSQTDHTSIISSFHPSYVISVFSLWQRPVTLIWSKNLASLEMTTGITSYLART